MALEITVINLQFGRYVCKWKHLRGGCFKCPINYFHWIFWCVIA
jgi:endonuclease III